MELIDWISLKGVQGQDSIANKSRLRTALNKNLALAGLKTIKPLPVSIFSRTLISSRLFAPSNLACGPDLLLYSSSPPYHQAFPSSVTGSYFAVCLLSLASTLCKTIAAVEPQRLFLRRCIISPSFCLLDHRLSLLNGSSTSARSMPQHCGRWMSRLWRTEYWGWTWSGNGA